MNKPGKMEKWKLIVTIVIFVIPLGGGLSASYISSRVDSVKAAVIETVNEELKRDYATKEEIKFILQSQSRLEEVVKETNRQVTEGFRDTNEKLYEIQKNQVLVRVEKDHLVQIQKKLSVVNNNTVDLKEQVQSQRTVIKSVLDKKKTK